MSKARRIEPLADRSICSAISTKHNPEDMQHTITERRHVYVVRYLKAVGSNPAHFSIRIQQFAVL